MVSLSIQERSCYPSWKDEYINLIHSAILFECQFLKSILLRMELLRMLSEAKLLVCYFWLSWISFKFFISVRCWAINLDIGFYSTVVWLSSAQCLFLWQNHRALSEGSVERGQSCKTWAALITQDLQKRDFSLVDAQNSMLWRGRIQALWHLTHPEV